MTKKRIRVEDQCWACDGKGKVFDTPRHRSTPCEECHGTGIDPEQAHKYEEEVEDAE